MATEIKCYDAVASMRKVRDKLSRRFKGMSFAEQKNEMEKLGKRQAHGDTKTKRRSA